MDLFGYSFSRYSVMLTSQGDICFLFLANRPDPKYQFTNDWTKKEHIFAFVSLVLQTIKYMIQKWREQ